MSEKQKMSSRANLLKQLRETHQDTVEQARILLKTQKSTRQQICAATRDNPKTVPEIAQVTGIPSDEVLWHVTAMIKYGEMTETGMCGEYYLYQRVEGK